MDEAPPIGVLSYTDLDGTVWVFTPGLRVWSAADGERYQLDEDFRAAYPDAPRPGE